MATRKNAGRNKVRRNVPRSGKDAGGGAANGGGGKRGIPLKGWEKGDIVRDVVIQPDGPQIPRKPGSRRVDRTVKAKGEVPQSDAAPVKKRRAAKGK
jgi:hypothetical protein